MDELEFRVLGPVEIRRRGQPVPAGGNALTVLAGLLFSANTLVAADTMAQWLWADNPPARPRAALHNTLWRLRRLLGPDALETLAGNYRVVTDAEHLDLLRFRELTAAAGRSAQEGALERAAELLDEALGLWREPVLANVDSPVLARDMVGQLTEQHLNCREFRAQVCLRLGWHADVIKDLSELVRAHPFRESAAGLLMLAFLGSGRRADALAVYGAVRGALRDDLGIDPGPALEDLHARIRNGPRPDRGGTSAQSRVTALKPTRA
jgi:DNA-binding SARP family transcriptional activator